MAKVVIFGTGSVAQVVHYYFGRDSEHEVCGFTVDEACRKEDEYSGLPLVPFERLEDYFPPASYRLFVAVNYRNVNKLRAERFRNAKERGYGFVSYVSSKAIHDGSSIGENTFIFASSVIQPFATIGDNCLIFGANHIGHHCVIKDHCFLTSDVVVGGGAIIGEYTFIGLNATIRNYIKVGRENIIGAGAVILSNTDDRAVFSAGQTPKFDVPSDLVPL